MARGSLSQGGGGDDHGDVGDDKEKGKEKEEGGASIPLNSLESYDPLKDGGDYNNDDDDDADVQD